MDKKTVYGKDGRKLAPIEAMIFNLLKNAEVKYGVKKKTLYEKLSEHNPFGNLKSHSITSLNMLKSIKDGLKHRLIEL